MKKLTYEYVKNKFEKEGYRLISDHYMGAHQKLDYVCPNGHKHNISWSKWKSGRRCPYCCKYTPINIKDIKNSFEEEGYKLLTKNYENARKKLEYICPKGHRHNISWDSWSRGRRCYYCNSNLPLSIDFVRKEFEKEGYVLLSNKWPGANKNLEYICPNGHVGEIRWSNWYSGARCLECSGKKKKEINFIKHNLEIEGYELLSNEYNGRNAKLFCFCPIGHGFYISWSSWVQGCRCPTCAIINNSGKNHYNWKGGISCEPYCDAWADKEYKESIKERDGYKCQNPNCRKLNCGLTIHHIDYNKKNCAPWNLITVCRSCNARANFNRNWHKKFYKDIIRKKYNYREV